MLAPSGGISKEDLDQRRQNVEVAKAAVEQALEAVYAIRVGLGLPAHPPEGQDLTEVPPNLDQNYSAVREALAELLRAAPPSSATFPAPGRHRRGKRLPILQVISHGKPQ